MHGGDGEHLLVAGGDAGLGAAPGPPRAASFPAAATTRTPWAVSQETVSARLRWAKSRVRAMSACQERTVGGSSHGVGEPQAQHLPAGGHPGHEGEIDHQAPVAPRVEGRREPAQDVRQGQEVAHAVVAEDADEVHLGVGASWRTMLALKRPWSGIR